MTRLSNKSGFTLIEVVVAIAVIGLSLLAAGIAICAQYYFIAQNRETILATLAAQEVIENIRSMPYDTIPADLTSTFNDPAGSYYPQALTYLKSPAVTVTRGDPAGDSTNIIEVSVNVSWTSSNKTLQRNLYTYVTREGIDRQ